MSGLRLFAAGALAVFLLAFQVVAAEAKPLPGDCRMPFRPAIEVDGASATEAEMQAVFDAILRFQEQLKTYRACLDAKIDEATRAGDKAKVEELTDLFNESVAVETEVVEAFNRELSEFEARAG